jgi:Helix-turn-helix domain
MQSATIEDVETKNRRGRRAAASPQWASDLPERRLYTVAEACRIAGISRTSFWRRRAQFDLRKMGRHVRVTAESLDAFITGLPAA